MDEEQTPAIYNVRQGQYSLEIFIDREEGLTWLEAINLLTKMTKEKNS